MNPLVKSIIAWVAILMTLFLVAWMVVEAQRKSLQISYSDFRDKVAAGEVEGEVRVLHAIVSGTVRGTLRAEKVEITSSGKVMADVHTPSLVISEGAFFEGRCFMRAETRSDEPERKKVAQMPLARKR